MTRSLLSAEDEVNWQVLNATLHYQSLPLNWHTYEVVYSQTQFEGLLLSALKTFFNVNEGSWLTIPQVIKATPFNSEDDYDNYLTRLHVRGLCKKSLFLTSLGAWSVHQCRAVRTGERAFCEYINSTRHCVPHSCANPRAAQCYPAVCPRILCRLVFNHFHRSSIFYEPWLRRNISDDKSSEALTVIESATWERSILELTWLQRMFTAHSAI